MRLDPSQVEVKRLARVKVSDFAVQMVSGLGAVERFRKPPDSGFSGGFWPGPLWRRGIELTKVG